MADQELWPLFRQKLTHVDLRSIVLQSWLAGREQGRCFNFAMATLRCFRAGFTTYLGEYFGILLLPQVSLLVRTGLPYS